MTPSNQTVSDKVKRCTGNQGRQDFLLHWRQGGADCSVLSHHSPLHSLTHQPLNNLFGEIARLCHGKQRAPPLLLPPPCDVWLASPARAFHSVTQSFLFCISQFSLVSLYSCVERPNTLLPQIHHIAPSSEPLGSCRIGRAQCSGASLNSFA
jgi:hypothetical protein